MAARRRLPACLLTRHERYFNASRSLIISRCVILRTTSCGASRHFRTIRLIRDGLLEKKWLSIGVYFHKLTRTRNVCGQKNVPGEVNVGAATLGSKDIVNQTFIMPKVHLSSRIERITGLDPQRIRDFLRMTLYLKRHICYLSPVRARFLVSIGIYCDRVTEIRSRLCRNKVEIH